METDREVGRAKNLSARLIGRQKVILQKTRIFSSATLEAPNSVITGTFGWSETTALNVRQWCNKQFTSVITSDYAKSAIHCQLNWAILLCDAIPDGKTEKTAQFWQAIAQASELSFPVVFHTVNCAVHSGNPTFSSVYLPTPRWHHLKALNKTDKTVGRSVLCQRKFCSFRPTDLLHYEALRRLDSSPE